MSNIENLVRRRVDNEVMQLKKALTLANQKNQAPTNQNHDEEDDDIITSRVLFTSVEHLSEHKQVRVGFEGWSLSDWKGSLYHFVIKYTNYPSEPVVIEFPREFRHQYIIQNTGVYCLPDWSEKHWKKSTTLFIIINRVINTFHEDPIWSDYPVDLSIVQSKTTNKDQYLNIIQVNKSYMATYNQKIIKEIEYKKAKQQQLDEQKKKEQEKQRIYEEQLQREKEEENRKRMEKEKQEQEEKDRELQREMAEAQKRLQLQQQRPPHSAPVINMQQINLQMPVNQQNQQMPQNNVQFQQQNQNQQYGQGMGQQKQQPMGQQFTQPQNYQYNQFQQQNQPSNPKPNFQPNFNIQNQQANNPNAFPQQQFNQQVFNNASQQNQASNPNQFPQQQQKFINQQNLQLNAVANANPQPQQFQQNQQQFINNQQFLNQQQQNANIQQNQPNPKIKFLGQMPAQSGKQ